MRLGVCARVVDTWGMPASSEAAPRRRTSRRVAMRRSVAFGEPPGRGWGRPNPRSRGQPAYAWSCSILDKTQSKASVAIALPQWSHVVLVVASTGVPHSGHIGVADHPGRVAERMSVQYSE